MRDLLRGFIALVSRLVPGGARREFRAEWDAEIDATCADRPRDAWTRAIGAVTTRCRW